MPNFLRLTHVHYSSREESECLVNMSTVTYIDRTTLRAGKHYISYYNEEHKQQMSKPVDTSEQTVTRISFAAGMNEECEAIYVLESLAEIENLL